MVWGSAGSQAGNALRTRCRALCGECRSAEEMRWVGVRGWWPVGGGALGPVGGLGLGLGASCVGLVLRWHWVGGRSYEAAG